MRAMVGPLGAGEKKYPSTLPSIMHIECTTKGARARMHSPGSVTFSEQVPPLKKAHLLHAFAQAYSEVGAKTR